MKDKIYFFLFVIGFALFDCKNSPNENNDKSLPIPITSIDCAINKINGVNADSATAQKIIIAKSDSLTNQNVIIKNEGKKVSTNWTIDDYILKCPKNSTSDLKQFIEYEIEQYKNVSNPIIAIYKGNTFGDYHHIEFEDANGKRYDFGFGDNDFGNIKLYFDDDQLTDNPKYLGKSFKVFWDWKISTFPCCSGEYKLVEAYTPSIIKLELIKTSANK